MDQIAELIAIVLTNTQPGNGANGLPSKAAHTLDEAVASKVAQQAAELVAAHPLYPAVNLT